jgi:hypothetical protein
MWSTAFISLLQRGERAIGSTLFITPRLAAALDLPIS